MVWLMVHESWFCSWFCSWFGIPLRPFKTLLDNVLLEHGRLYCVLPCAVHPDFEYPPDTHLIPPRPFKNVFDNVLLEHGGLPHVLPLAVHLIFLPEQVEGVILSHFYSLSFLVRGFLHAHGWDG